jgi:ABC-2 type transport system ATP-binding protein
MTALARTMEVTRRYGDVLALDRVSLEIRAGELVGLLGPNGAGKSTLINLFVGLRRPTSGTVELLGGSPGDPAVRRGIGVTPQETGLPESLRVGEIVRFVSAHFPGKSAESELLERFGLGDLVKRQVGGLSGGQKRRVAVALGLVHNPPLLFLDEPTTGLDPQNRANLWDRIRQLRESGTTVLLSTHYLDEADALCDRLVIVDHGLIVAQGTPGELKREVSGDVVTLRLTESERAAEALKPFAREVRVDEDALRVYVDDGEHMLPALLRTLEEQGIGLSSIALDRSTLDDVFLAKTGRSLRDVGAAT